MHHLKFHNLSTVRVHIVTHVSSFIDSARIHLIQNRPRHIISTYTSRLSTQSHTVISESLLCSHHRYMSSWAGAGKKQTKETFVSWRKQLVSGFSIRSVSHVSKPAQSNTCDGDRSSKIKDVCEDMYKNIVFRNDNIVAVNKPYGLSVHGSSPKVSEKTKDKSQVDLSSIISLTGALSKLGNKLNFKELDVALSLKSFYSGVVLLSTHEKSQKKLKQVLAENVTQKLQFMTYLAVTVGEPQCPYGENLTLPIRRDRLHDREMSVVGDTVIRNACKRGEMIQTCFSVTPLVVNKSVGAALVRITLNKDKWEVVEVLMSHYLSPVLGDHIYSSRTLTVAGVPVPTSAHTAFPGKQKLPSTIAELLQSNADSAEGTGPVFVHRHRVVLNKFPTRASPPLVITAPPQKEFLTTLQCLGLYRDRMFS